MNSDFTFGTGKFGDLAGFTSAIVLAMIAILIGQESVTRFLAPVQIHFAEATLIACRGLALSHITIEIGPPRRQVTSPRSCGQTDR